MPHEKFPKLPPEARRRTGDPWGRLASAILEFNKKDELFARSEWADCLRRMCELCGMMPTNLEREMAMVTCKAGT